jgi:hypothetical protein
MKTVGRLLLDSLRFAGRHAASLLIIAGLLIIPAVLIKAAAPSLAAWAGVPANLRDGALAKVGQGIVQLVEFLVLILTGSAITLFVARDRVGQPLDWRGAWRLGLRRARPALTGAFASLLAQFGYLFLFGVAAASARRLVGDFGVGRAAYEVLGFSGILFISTRMAVVGSVTAIERTGGFDGYDRNRDLLNGRFLLALAVLFPLQLGHQGLLKVFAAIPVGPVASSLREVVLTVLYAVIGGIASTMLYLWLRGSAAPLGADEVGVPAAVVPPTAEVTT